MNYWCYMKVSAKCWTFNDNLHVASQFLSYFTIIRLRTNSFQAMKFMTCFQLTMMIVIGAGDSNHVIKNTNFHEDT